MLEDGNMRYYIRIYMGQHIKNIEFPEEDETISIGSSSHDTVCIYGSNIIPSHLLFTNNNGKWICHNSMTHIEKEIQDGDLFVLNAESKIVAIICSDNIIPQTVKLKPYSRISIGRNFDCLFHLPDRSVSRKHAEIIVDELGVSIRDLNSLNGTYLNNNKISYSSLKDGDIISIGKFTILYQKNILKLCLANEIEEREQTKEVKYPIFSLSPRLRHQMPSETIEIQAPPDIGSMPVINWLSFIPMLAMRNAYAAIFPLTSVFATFLQKRKYKKANEVRQEKYENYLADVKAKIEKNRDDQYLSLEESNHETRQCYDIAVNRERTLWERSFNDDDFMKIRVGKGDITVSFKIKFPDSVLKIYTDDLSDEGEDLGKGSQIIEDAPILCDLYNDLSVGVVGDREKVLNIARNMIIQVATTHPYTAVKIITIYSKREQKMWDFVKWLPHSFSDDRTFRYMANDVFNSSILDKRIVDEFKDKLSLNKTENSINKIENNIFYLFVISDPELIEYSEIENYLDANSVGSGFGVIYAYNKIKELPQSCNVIIEAQDDKNEIYNKSNIGTKQQFEIDHFSIDKAEKFARSLAPVRLLQKKGKTDIPTSVTLLEGYGVQNADELPIWENWNNTNPAKSIAVPIGVKANGEQFVFNMMYGSDFMRYHGPFGLVAGTNGSGKSEMMQSWILSLAMKFPPQELSFIIIDYKGTGLLLPFKDLPHLSGKISNLDGNVKRNIIALNREMKRRQTIFDKVGIVPQDIKEYYKQGFHKTYQSLPVTIIVIDEFAEVKKNLPEFVPVLESIFAIGRSLGIFAIVSTQKPSGVVTDKMYANSKFRWCCRVSSSADSKEMLHHIDAAKITNAGRAYVQVGEDDIYEQVQSFWSGAPYTPGEIGKKSNEIPISRVEINGRRYQYETYSEKAENKVKEIDAVIEAINKVKDEHNVSKAEPIWQDRLPYRIYIDDIIKDNRNVNELKIPVGMIDNPYEQSQYPLEIDLSGDGHCFVWGAPGTGKTTFLQTAIMAAAKCYEPTILNIYAMDFGSWSLNLFSQLPHVGGVANDNEEDKIDKLVKMINKELDARKKLFAMNGVINIKSYEQTTGKRLPFILIVIDNLNALFSLYPDLDEFFLRLSRESASYGIYILATVSGSTGISYKVVNNIKNNIALRLKDKSEYINVVGKTDGLEPESVDGRGLVRSVPFALEYQTALPARGEDDSEVLKNIKIDVDNIAKSLPHYKAKAIPIMPDVISYNSILSNNLVLGISVDTIEPVTIDFNTSPHCFVISGADKSDRCNIQKVILKQFAEKADATVVTFDNGRDTLSNLNISSAKHLKTSDELDSFVEELVSELNYRKGCDNLDACRTIVLGIDGYSDMYDAIADKTATRLLAMVRMGKGLKVFIVASEIPDKIANLASIEMTLKTMVSQGIGILVGESMRSHNAFETNMNFTESNVTLNEFEAYLIEDKKSIRFKAMNEI